MAGSDDENPPPPSQTPTQQAPHTMSTIKLPILKKGKYDIWALKNGNITLAYRLFLIWEVIQKGNGPVSVSTDINGVIKVLPPKTAKEILARERERKARTTLLMALPEDHLAKFHKMTDAKEMWDAIKSRFGGNDESKKMQKYILKQQFEGFSVSNSEGLHKGYDRFQSLLSQLEIHGAGVSTEDANQKFLRSLPSSWSQVSLVMRTKPGVDNLSFDDLYNNLRVFESDVKGSTGSSSSAQNVAFVSSESTSSTNDVSTAYGVSTSSGYNSQRENSSSYTDELMYSFFANPTRVAMISMRLKKFYKKTGRRLQFDAKEPVGFDKTKVECFNCHKTGHFARECRSKGNQESRRRDAGNTGYKAKDNGRRPGKQEEPKALVTLDGEGVDWTGHAEDEQENFALMAYSNSGSDTEMCDKKNKVLFTDTECLVLSSDFKLPDENQATVNESNNGIDQPVRSENQANKTAGLKEANHSAGTQDNINAGNSKIEADPAQDYFVLPICSSYTSTIKSSEAKNEGEKPNKDTGLKTNEEPVSHMFFSAGGTLLKTTMTKMILKYCSEDIYRNPSDGIFTNASYDDEGAVADFTNLESTMNVVLITTFKQRRNNHKDFQHCLFACFLSQIKPKKVFEALEDESWVDAMQEELLQFKIQKVWILVDFPYGKKAIRTKWVYRNKDEEVFTLEFFYGLASYMGIIVYQNVCEECFLYGTIDEGCSWCEWNLVALMKSRFQMSYMGELTFFLGLQVKQKEDGIFISQDKFQVTPKTSHLHAVKRIFRYLKGKPKLGLWYPRESSFNLVAYSDSDYGGANLDRKSTTGGCQFLGRRLISWQCKKQTIMATSTTEVEYVVAANCYGQLLWIQNQMLEYRFNFMNTKIYIDNESTICIVKNPVFHSKTKHIEIRHHFIKDAYEKKLIQVLKIHTDDNVANLLTKAFDVSRFNFLVVSIGMMNVVDDMMTFEVVGTAGTKVHTA
ncbi:ribonuclease H-like domain-containing protein, partial [Tanacetum coccineum]